MNHLPRISTHYFHQYTNICSSIQTHITHVKPLSNLFPLSHPPAQRTFLLLLPVNNTNEENFSLHLSFLTVISLFLKLSLGPFFIFFSFHCTFSFHAFFSFRLSLSLAQSSPMCSLRAVTDACCGIQPSDNRISFYCSTLLSDVLFI